MNSISVDVPLTEPIPFTCEKSLKIIVRLPGQFEVAFAIDPNSAESQDDKFILYSTDDENTYFQEKTPKDNISEEKGTTMIRFTGLKKDLNYSLGVDPGIEGKPYLVFENLAYGGWESGPLDPDMKVEFKMKFAIDPNEKESRDDTFVLASTDSEQKINIVKTIKDDLTKGDDNVEILFDKLDRSLNYSLQVNPGNESDPYFVFEDRPYADLSKGNS